MIDAQFIVDAVAKSGQNYLNLPIGIDTILFVALICGETWYLSRLLDRVATKEDLKQFTAELKAVSLASKPGNTTSWQESQRRQLRKKADA